MSLTEDILENRIIETLAKSFSVPPQRVNKLHEADAELIDLGEGYGNYLALTIDALAEEITTGLYDDPHFIGWMLAMVNFSDLAAVGADPLGLLITVNYSSQDNTFLAELAKGISEACRHLNTFVLGGDTNQGEKLLLSGCAAGIVPKESLITRIGAQPGDRLYLSGPAGQGSVYAFLRLKKPQLQVPSSFYKPSARIKEGKLLRKFASCSMDTSDGLVHTLDTLMRLNRSHFILYDNWEKILHPVALNVCQAQNLPFWLPLAGVHGEFELCFSIRPQNERNFLDEAARAGWAPIPIGEVKEGWGVSIQKKGKLIDLDTALIRNLAMQAGSDPFGYLRQLQEYALGRELDF